MDKMQKNNGIENISNDNKYNYFKKMGGFPIILFLANVGIILFADYFNKKIQ
jgi:hypothetical protein